MKYLLLIPFLLSIGTFAQDVEYKYEPVVNKAEYYIGSYKNGKDLDDNQVTLILLECHYICLCSKQP